MILRKPLFTSPSPNTPEKEVIIDESQNEVIYFNEEGKTSEPFRNPESPKNKWLVDEIEFRVNNLNNSSMLKFSLSHCRMDPEATEPFRTRGLAVAPSHRWFVEPEEA